MRRFSLASLAAMAALISGLLVSPAAAFHIPGASYSGPMSGGGTISFTVSGDGSSVTNLTLDGPIQGDPCKLIFRKYPGATPINHAVVEGVVNAFDNGEVSGNFPGVQRAEGSFDVSFGGGPAFGGCHVTGSWTAATSASPAGSAECIAAEAQVKKLKSALGKAKKAGNQAKIKKLKKKLRNARTYRDQVCG